MLSKLNFEIELPANIVYVIKVSITPLIIIKL